VGRAVRDLQQRGYIDRIAGSGTWVRRPRRASTDPLLFGLIIPRLGETEIFEPICQGIARAPQAAAHALLWGHSNLAGERQMLELCRQYIQRSVSGVFFAPIEMMPDAGRVNRRVLGCLREAGAPVVLLDRRPDAQPRTYGVDLVGIDNRRAGYLAAEHLINSGARRIGFLYVEHQAPTAQLRLAGFRDALNARGLHPATECVIKAPVPEALDLRWKRGAFDGFVCANDRLAGLLMHTLLACGVRIPQDVRIIGIDDVAYASLLPVPLTTIHQPCREIGEAALRVMLERIERPAMPARDVLLDCWLVVRKSCGAASG
jgi:GntR family transcriptional regulator of arabinose operon